MNEYINLTLENIDEEHICCAIGDKKHQAGVESKKKWIKSKLKELNKILDSSKTMIIRDAAGRKIPHSRVFKDEIIYFMEKGTKMIQLLKYENTNYYIN